MVKAHRRAELLAISKRYPTRKDLFLKTLSRDLEAYVLLHLGLS